MPTDKSGSANASRSISKFVNGLRKEHEGISVLKKKEVEDWAKTLLQLYRIALCHEEEGESLAQFAAGIESLYVATVGKHAKVPFVSLHGVKLDDINDIFEETMEFLPLCAPGLFLDGIALVREDLFPTETLERSVFAVIDSLCGGRACVEPNPHSKDMLLALVSDVYGWETVDSIVEEADDDDVWRAYVALKKFVSAKDSEQEAFEEYMAVYGDMEDDSAGDDDDDDDDDGASDEESESETDEDD
jgi:hypothetical protein